LKMDSLELYNKYYSSRDYERLELFQKISEKQHIEHVLYPGSFVHITPSFVFPHVVYVDSDKKAARFFKDPVIYEFISRKKKYPERAKVVYHQSNFATDFNEKEESFDLLISQSAGFVSFACKKYLKVGGILIVNNSHGDASMASIDSDYMLIAVYHRRNGLYMISNKNLKDYFIPKSDIEVTKAYLEKIQRGIGYTKTASWYIFRRV